MTMLIEDHWLEEKLKEQRRVYGSDRYDDVWEGVYFMAPLPNDEHQEILGEFLYVLGTTINVPHLGNVRPGVNLAASADDWEYDYRVQDAIVFLANTAAKCYHDFWTGPADFVLEITTAGDRTYEKIAFYSRIGVRELLILNRQKSSLELYRHNGVELQQIGESTLTQQDILASQMLPLKFRLMPGDARPQVEVIHTMSGERWVV